MDLALGERVEFTSQNERTRVNHSESLRVEDTQLIERARTDSDALTELYHRYQSTISAYVLRRVNCRHEAEDIVSDVFVGMVRGISRYRVGKAPFVTWLYRIATNEIARRVRKKRVRHFFGTLLHCSEEEPEASDTQARLHLAIRQLSRKSQDVITLYYFEQLGIDDIATILKCAPGTVKSRLSRAREQIRDHIRLHETDV